MGRSWIKGVATRAMEIMSLSSPKQLIKGMGNGKGEH